MRRKSCLYSFSSYVACSLRFVSSRSSTNLASRRVPRGSPPPSSRLSSSYSVDSLKLVSSSRELLTDLIGEVSSKPNPSGSRLWLEARTECLNLQHMQYMALYNYNLWGTTKCWLGLIANMGANALVQATEQQHQETLRNLYARSHHNFLQRAQKP
jgi:hypothetical protein